MKKIVLLLLCLLLLPFYVVKGETTDQINNQLEAGVNYSPTFYSESYVSNFLHPMSAPILPENIGPRMLLEQGWKIWHPPKGMKLIPQETLKPWPFDYDIFENDYAVF